MNTWLWSNMELDCSVSWRSELLRLLLLLLLLLQLLLLVSRDDVDAY